jgi:uncharacterized protein (DUF1501 family)
MIGFKERDLKDTEKRSTIISNDFGLHPSLSAIKPLYDQGRVAAILGVGHPNPSGSHFFSQDIWYTANPVEGKGDGWLGKYAEKAFSAGSGVRAMSVLNGRLPKALSSKTAIIPNVTSFEAYGFRTDAKYPDTRASRLNIFDAGYNRDFSSGSLEEALTGTGRDAVAGSSRIFTVPEHYSSNVIYPADGQLARALKMMAQVIVALPESSLLYVQWGFFDHHSHQILNAKDKLSGPHAALLKEFSESVKAFYDDMTEHGLADDVVIMQWSEFGRRPQENRSMGTDHGSASSLFVIGNPVKGGLYGEQPSLAANNLDEAGNPRFTVDFRSVYSTILEDWLETDSLEILGKQFDNLGFFR